MTVFMERTGLRYGKWLVIGYSGLVDGRHQWRLKCDCGTEVIKNASSLARGGGCQNCKFDGIHHPTETHGHAKGRTTSSDYNSWMAMIQRTTNPNAGKYPDYGGKGISVCDRWRDFAVFLADMGPKPTPRHTIDRLDNKGNYEPGNCRWATKVEQRRNQRSVRTIVYMGKQMMLTDAAKFAGIPFSVVRQRLHRGWSLDRALSTPVLSPSSNR